MINKYADKLWVEDCWKLASRDLFELVILRLTTYWYGIILGIHLQAIGSLYCNFFCKLAWVSVASRHQSRFSWSKTWLHRLGDDWIFQSTRALQSKLYMVWLESHPSCCHRLFQFSWTWHVNRSKNNLASGLRGSASSLVPGMKNKRMNCMLCIKLLPTFTYYFPLFLDTFLKNLITCMMDINAWVEI